MSIEAERHIERDILSQLWSVFASRWAVARRKARVRREYQELMYADDRILKDLGLTRMQVDFERRRHKRWRI